MGNTFFVILSVCKNKIIAGIGLFKIWLFHIHYTVNVKSSASKFAKFYKNNLRQSKDEKYFEKNLLKFDFR